MDVITEQRADLERVLAAIPEDLRGIGFDRVFDYFHPQKNTSQLERAFAELWALRNTEGGTHVLTSLLYGSAMTGKEPDARAEYLPANEREWKVACLIAATVIQWLPTSVGCAFLREAFERGGGRFHYELPPSD